MDQNKTGNVGTTCQELVTKLKTSLDIVKIAAKKIGFPYKEIGVFKDILIINTPKQELYFWLNKNPFNDSFIFQLGQDKFLQYQIFLNNKIPIPTTYFKINEQTNIPKKLSFPIVYKPINSSFSRGVKLLYEFNSQNYQTQNFLLQQFIKGNEFRFLVVKNKIKLAYSKVGNIRFNETYKNNDNYKPIILQNKALIQKVQPIVNKLFSTLNANFLGLDIIFDSKNNPYLIEINANPVCYYYTKFYGKEDFIQIYLELLQEYQN